MGYSSEIKESVRRLRSEGKTYFEIMEILKLRIPKSTLSSWCADVVLPPRYQEKVDNLNRENLTKGQKMALIANKVKHEKLVKALETRNIHLQNVLENRDTLKMILSMLYLGEGAKWKSHRGLMLGSSDPNIILLYIKLLRLCYHIPLSKLRCRISYRADQDINSIQKFWSDITLIPLENFYKTKPDPRTIGKITRQKDYKGVCVIMCSGTEQQLELELIPKIILRGL